MEDWAPEIRTKEPEREVHELSGKIGFCSDCGDLHLDEDLGPLKENAGGEGLAQKVRESMADHDWVCSYCGTPMARTREEAEKADSCWWCGGSRAMRKSTFEEQKEER